MKKAIIGLGNPGKAYYYTRHNIGFRVLDKLAQEWGLAWRNQDNQEIATYYDPVTNQTILLLKPQTFMNNSGAIMPGLFAKNITPENSIVVHDDLELPFGAVMVRKGGSARGHNGLKSIIAVSGPDFYRVRCGIGRPDNKLEVPDYVLRPFTESKQEVENMIEKAVQLLKQEFLEKSDKNT